MMERDDFISYTTDQFIKLYELRKKWVEMNDNRLPLSQAITALRLLVDAQYEEYYFSVIVSKSDVNFYPRHENEKEKLARSFGYPSVVCLKLHAELRTSSKWVYKYLGC